jgi:hypothetical protein
MYFFSSNNNYVIQKYALSPEGMFANTRFSREQCWQTLLFVLRENVCKYLTQTIERARISADISGSHLLRVSRLVDMASDNTILPGFTSNRD